ncbi:ABC transporter ATP-binding protein [Parvularcula sp. IMCC14364]|uniref:ABC transporter ATP-binding protein n=1 Tax=Parvularcula sp. IMCC14364 TaxID=3067902 RepID=UPI0035570CB1
MFRWFENIVPPFPEDAPERPPEKLGSFIWYYTKPFRWLLLSGLLISGFMAVIELMIFDFIGALVDWLATADRSTFFETHGTPLIIMAVLVMLIWPVAALIDDTITHQGLLGNFAMQIRWRGHRYLLRQSTSFFADDFAGRLSTKVMQTALGVRDAVIQVTNLFVYVGVYFAGAIFLFAGSDWRLTIPILLWVLGYGTVMVIFLPKLKDLSQEQSDARSVVTGRIVDAYTNIQTVKMFSCGSAEDQYARKGMEGMLDTVYRQMRQVTWLSFWLHVLNSALITATLGLGFWLWAAGQIEAGALAVAGALLMRLQGMSHWFLWEVAGLFESIGSVQDGIETISQPISVTDVASPQDFSVTRGEIRFDNVSFHYGKSKGVLSDFDLSIDAGEKVGLIGRSGAGKSTLINLLLRLYDTEKGSILIDGQQINCAKQEDLRRNIAVVTQDTSLLHRSIRENIAYGQADASMESIINAARLAEAHDFIPDLTDGKGRSGYDAHVGERGVKLSGGQRQRIAIARVILKDAPILVLDEATSALDSEAEAAIQGQLNNLMQGKTVIAIAHRLSTIAAMDRLIVLDQGKIVEEGTHQTLIEKDGIYAGLWSRQSGGFLMLDGSAQTAAE